MTGIWYDEVKAPKLYAGWRAMLGVLADGQAKPYLDVLLAGVEAGLAPKTVRNMIVDARLKKGWMVQAGSKKKDTVRLRLTDAGRGVLDE